MFVGVNSRSKQVAIKNTLGGAETVFGRVGDFFGQKTQQRVIGPQTSETRARIVLPSGDTLPGNGYKTKDGGFAVSNETVASADGRVGRLAKYTLGKDGNQYLII